MRIHEWGLILALLTGRVTADAHVTTISVAAKGVLCLSCVYRMEKAIRRVEGVEKVHVQISPALAQVTPKAGAWVEADQLLRAVRAAGFKPGEVRYTLTGALVEWRGQPAVRLPGIDRMIVLQAEPGASEALDHARVSPSEPGARTVEVEGQWVDTEGRRDRAAPETLRVHRLLRRD